MDKSKMIELAVLNEVGAALTFANNGMNSLRNAAEHADQAVKKAPAHLRGELEATSAQLWALWDHAQGTILALRKVHTELRTGRPTEL